MPYKRTYLLLAFWMVSSNFPLASSSDSSSEECGDIQHNVEKGMIRLPDFSGESVKDINCSWTYVAPPDRQLLVKVDSVYLPPSDVRSSSLQLYVDDQLYDIPRNCVKCLREMVGGKTIRVQFFSYLITATEHPLGNGTGSESVGSFQVRYKSFDPHRCSKPEQVENGHIVSKGRKLGQSVFYRCNPPYDLSGESEVHCVVPPESPVPEWSAEPPRCIIPLCGNEPVTREAGSGSIASPGYPTYMYNFTVPCQWVITSQLNQQIKASITYLNLPKQESSLTSENISRLSLIDGDAVYIANLTEPITNGSFNFTTLSNKLTVHFVVSKDNKGKDEVGFYMDYSAVSSSCPKPKPPENGEVSGYGNGLGSVITYSCHKGFALVGEFQSECMMNGQWSHSVPSCEPLIVENQSFLLSTNNSETVTTKLVDEPVSSETELGSVGKPSRNGKRKGKDFSSPKTSPRPFDTKEKATEPNLPEVSSPAEDGQSKSGETKSRKKHDKDHGPKSEPHLSQVIPAKETMRKGKADPHAATADLSDKRQGNSTRTQTEEFPDVGPGLAKDAESDEYAFVSVTMIAIIAGLGAPAAVALILLIAILIYRRRYPVRMRFGRKFSTFENPMYVTKDAHHPRELKRLTTA